MMASRMSFSEETAHFSRYFFSSLKTRSQFCVCKRGKANAGSGCAKNL